MAIVANMFAKIQGIGRRHNSGFYALWPGQSSQALCTLLTATLLLIYIPCFSIADISEGEALVVMAKEWGVASSLPTWVAGTDPCTSLWDGILCDGQGHVNTLNLTNMGLKGPIPQAISSLTSLTNLDLSNAVFLNGTWNAITGDLQELSTVPSLQNLNMSYNKFGNQVSFPDAVLGLTNLISLRMDHCGLVGQFPPTISSIKNLQFLYLGNNSMTGPLPKELGSLVNLQELTLWGNKFSSEIPTELQYLKKLNYLNLHECNLWGGLPPEFGNLKSMKRLLLYKNSLTGPIPDRLQNMVNLTDLRLDSNYLYSQLKTWVLQMPNINTLFLGSNLIYGAFPNVTTTQVQILSLDCNFLSGPVPTLLNISINNNCFQGKLQDDSANLVCSRAYTCASFEAETSNGVCPTCPDSQTLFDSDLCVCHMDQSSQTMTNKSTIISAVAGSVATCVVFVSIGIFLLLRWKKSQKSVQDETDPFDSEKPCESDEHWDVPKGVQRFHYQDLEKATSGFSEDNEIGSGGYGKVFVGTFADGKMRAIKRASATGSQGRAEFRNEVLLLSRLHHKNLVRLEGFCEEKQILVYEYMKLGNLHSHLFRKGMTRGLNWYKRLEIAVGIARALDYLHTHADPPVIHRDVKPANILLDDSLTAKVADFGISKTSSLLETHISTDLAGTAGYFDPQYFLRHQLTTASDVYAFGVVLLELVTGQKVIDHSREDANLMAWAKPRLRADGIKSIVDPLLMDDYPIDTLFDMADLALKCTSIEKEDRPTMRSVLARLEPFLESHKVPMSTTPTRSSTSWEVDSSEGPHWPCTESWSTGSSSAAETCTQTPAALPR